MQTRSVVASPDFAIYRGIVEDNNDTLCLGRVRVRIPPIHGTKENIPTEHLPFASICFLGASSNSGSFIVPEIGSTVMVTFENGDRNLPLVLGCVYTSGKEIDTTVSTSETSYQGGGRVVKAGTNDVPSQGQEDISSRVIYQSPKGSSLTFYDTDDSESIEIRDANGNSIVLSSPINEASSKDNKHTSSSAKDNLLNVSQIALSNAFGQLIKIISNGSQGIINVVDEINAQGLEVNAGGYTRLFNQKKDGVEVYITQNAVTLKTAKAELSITDGVVNIQAPTVNINGTTMKLNANNLTLEAPTIKMNGNISGGTFQCHHAPAFSVTGSGNAPKVSVTAPSVWVDPSETLTKVTSTVAKDSLENITKSKKQLNNIKSSLESLKAVMGNSSKTLSSLSGFTQITDTATAKEISSQNLSDNIPETLIITSGDSKKEVASKLLAQQTYLKAQKTDKTDNTVTIKTALGSAATNKVDDSTSKKSYTSTNQATNFVMKELNALGISSSDISETKKLLDALSNLSGSQTGNKLSAVITSLSSDIKRLETIESSINRAINASNTKSLKPQASTAKNDINRLLISANNISNNLNKQVVGYTNVLTSISDSLGNNQFTQIINAFVKDFVTVTQTLYSINSNIESCTSMLKSDITTLTDPKSSVVQKVSLISKYARNGQNLANLKTVYNKINQLDDMSTIKAKLNSQDK